MFCEFEENKLVPTEINDEIWNDVSRGKKRVQPSFWARAGALLARVWLLAKVFPNYSRVLASKSTFKGGAPNRQVQIKT